MVKKATSIRLDDETIRLREELAKKLGITKAAVIALAIRKLAKQEGVK